MKKNEIAVISANGYQANRKTSLEATEWLEFRKLEFPNLCHGRNGKEVQIGRYLLMVMMSIRRPLSNTMAMYFTVAGTHRANRPSSVSHSTMAQVYAYHQEKVAFLRSNGYNVEVMWSCEWKNLRETDDQAQFVFLALNLQAPLKPKDAFKGGRTNGFRLFYERKADERISHMISCHYIRMLISTASILSVIRKSSFPIFPIFAVTLVLFIVWLSVLTGTISLYSR